MAIRKILAPLTGGERDRVVLASAFAAAKPFAAHVVALFVRPDPAEAMPFFGEGVSAVVVQEIVDVAKSAADKAAETARATLRSISEEAGVVLLAKPTRTDSVSASFRDVQGNFSDCVTKCARLSDLVAFGPLREEEKPGLTEAFETTLLETGRPLLLSAFAPPLHFFEKIALAWDGSLASAHAVGASMPFLRHASEIEVLSVQRGATPNPNADLHEYLALHGLRCTDRIVETQSKPVGQLLLDTAVADGVGLLVLGGYGHSRLRQLFVGGITRHVVSHATVPLFLVH